MHCSTCKTRLEENDRFCSGCGAETGDRPQQTETDVYRAKYILDFREANTMANQIRTAFFKLMEKIIEADFGNNEFRKYFDEFYKSEFYKSFDLRTEQLAEEVHAIRARGSNRAELEIDRLLDTNFHALIDHFLVIYCQALHRMQLPEAMLQYVNQSNSEGIDIRQMVFDFLDFEKEKDKVYLELTKIPPAKIKNAIHSFLFSRSSEKIFFICDQTIFGSCQEGFAMTEKGLYWKSHFNPPQSVFYEELDKMEREAEWLNINGAFFNVNKTMNYKMMKLLRRLKILYMNSLHEKNNL